MGRMKSLCPRMVIVLSIAPQCFCSIFFDVNNFLIKRRSPLILRLGPPHAKLKRPESVMTMNVQQAIAEFLEHGQSVRNLSDRTLRAYQSDLTQFNIHMSDAHMVDITPEHLEGYLDKLGTGPYRDTSIRRKVAALKVFFRFLEEQGIVHESPARKLKLKRPVESRVPTVLSTREVRALLSAPKDQISDLSAMRDQSAGGRNRYFCA